MLFNPPLLLLLLLFLFTFASGIFVCSRNRLEQEATWLSWAHRSPLAVAAAASAVRIKLKKRKKKKKLSLRSFSLFECFGGGKTFKLPDRPFHKFVRLISVHERHNFRRSTGFETLKLENGRSGVYFNNSSLSCFISSFFFGKLVSTKIMLGVLAPITKRMERTWSSIFYMLHVRRFF